MKEDLLRHALTASLAALLASLGTAALVGGGGAAASVRPASPPARRDPIDDAALLEALERIEGAVVAVQTSVERTAVERRRAATVAPAAPGPAGGDEARSTANVGAPDEERAITPAAPEALELNEAAIRAFSRRREGFESLLDADQNEDPRRPYYLRSMRDLVAEFGHPTYCHAGEGKITTTWTLSDDERIRASFVDGLRYGASTTITHSSRPEPALTRSRLSHGARSMRRPTCV